MALQLGIALRAVIELTLHEPRSKRIMAETPEGIAYFCVGAEGYGAWLEWRNRFMHWRGSILRLAFRENDNRALEPDACEGMAPTRD